MSDRLPRLDAATQRLQPLVDEPVTLPGSGRCWPIRRPTDLDALLDQVADDPEQNLPYWSEIWPSGIALADAILAEPGAVAGRRVLEIGSGLGITACAALLAGAELTVTDYASESLLLSRFNTLRNVGREPVAKRLNWRTPPLDVAEIGGEYPVILAADVLYEARDIEPFLRFVDALLAPDGLFWLAEPERPVAARFLDVAAASGWRGSTSVHHGPWPDPKDQGVRVRIHQLRRMGAANGDSGVTRQSRG
jgi:predicted nicotinamide N-methyase